MENAKNDAPDVFDLVAEWLKEHKLNVTKVKFTLGGDNAVCIATRSKNKQSLKWFDKQIHPRVWAHNYSKLSTFHVYDVHTNHMREVNPSDPNFFEVLENCWMGIV